MEVKYSPWLFLALSLLFGSTGLLHGFTDPHGYLQGTLRDASGNPVAAALVSAEQEAIGLRRQVVSDNRGRFFFNRLPLGSYGLTVKSESFHPHQTSDIRVNLGAKTTLEITLFTLDVRVRMIVEERLERGDLSSTVAGLNIDFEHFMDLVPVKRGFGAVALLAPGAIAGDTAFDDLSTGQRLVSVGGASVAENAAYLNGLNITNFRNGLGSSRVPFAFLQEIQVKTGAYQAEFGRAMGGVLNSVTRGGTNQWKFGISSYWEPSDQAAKLPDTFASLNSAEERSTFEGNLSLGGPLLKDRLFLFAVYSPRERKSQVIDFTRDSVFVVDDPFWGLKIDGYLAPGHSVSVTAFSDKESIRETDFNYDAQTGRRTGLIGNSLFLRGGENYLARYTGILLPSLTLSAQYGINRFARSDTSETSEFPVVIDNRQGLRSRVGLWSNALIIDSEDERRAFRLDLDLFFGNHDLRAGLDFEKNHSDHLSTISGGRFLTYSLAGPDNIWGLPAETEIASEFTRDEGGFFQVETRAFYLQDSWRFKEHWTLNMGLRNTSFDNRNAVGASFLKVNRQPAPRLGLIWDPGKKGRSKLFAYFGRFFLPFATTANINLAGRVFSRSTTYEVAQINESSAWTFEPASVLDDVVLGDGQITDPDGARDLDIKPMYQDEMVLGYQFRVKEHWDFGLRAVFRDLGRAIENVTIDGALNRLAAAQGNEDFASGFDYYVLANPGHDIRVRIDIDGDGNPDEIRLSREDLGYPAAKRRYYALETTFERYWADRWMVKGSYTWSHSYGNYEGWVHSDNGQRGAGFTDLFDLPGLLDGASGNLPNDRRHSLKLFGAYAFGNGLQLGADFRLQSGRPRNALGLHPSDDLARAYGVISFYQNGVLAPRGSLGTTETIKNLDLTAQYPFRLGIADIKFRVDIFNLFNFEGVSEVVERSETRSGAANPNFNAPSQYQSPRTVRLGLTIDF